MGVSIKMSGDLERQVKKVAQRALDDQTAKYQSMLERLRRQYQGRPVDVIKPILLREWKRLGGTISEPNLTRYAEFLSNGTRIKLKADRIR